jgi:hypothetical protein
MYGNKENDDLTANLEGVVGEQSPEKVVQRAEGGGFFSPIHKRSKTNDPNESKERDLELEISPPVPTAAETPFADKMAIKQGEEATAADKMAAYFTEKLAESEAKNAKLAAENKELFSKIAALELNVLRCDGNLQVVKKAAEDAVNISSAKAAKATELATEAEIKVAATKDDAAFQVDAAEAKTKESDKVSEMAVLEFDRAVDFKIKGLEKDILDLKEGYEENIERQTRAEACCAPAWRVQQGPAKSSRGT